MSDRGGARGGEGEERRATSRIDDAIGDADIYTPVFAVQREYGLPSGGPASSAGRCRRPTSRRGEQKPAGKPPGRVPAAAAKSAGAADRRIATLLQALRADPNLTPAVDADEKQVAERGRKFGKNGLKTKNGKLFALFTQGTLVVKLPNERVAALVASRVGEEFDPGHGRLMKGWLTVTSAKASWMDLARRRTTS